MDDLGRKHTIMARLSRDTNDSTSSIDSPTITKQGNRRHVNREFDQDFINLDHIKDLARALAQDPYSGTEASSEHISIASLSPISRRMGRKKKPVTSFSNDNDTIGTPKGISYTLLRYPLMVCMCFSLP